jgi:uncharacterized membrane protein
MFPEPLGKGLWFRLVLLLVAVPSFGQAPQKPAGQAPTANSQGAKKPAASSPAPQSKHYPILLIAAGTEPFWSVRIGMKGAERLERVSYPPITLEPGEIAPDDSGTAWIYRAKDTGTGAAVTVRLSREACSDGMSDNKYSFKAAVTHAQIGELKGCARIAADQFPEFKQKNLDDDDPEKKKVVPPAITGFKPPVAVAFIDATGKVLVARGEVTKVAAPKGYQPALSHDGKRLLFTRDEQGTERTIVLFDALTGKSTDLVRGMVQEAFWSPDDASTAFLKFTDQAWHVWTMPSGAPEKAAQLAATGVLALHGWQDIHTVLASDASRVYFLKTESPSTSVELHEIYGDVFSVGSSDTIRANPLNSDLLLVTAAVAHPASGMPTEGHTGMGSAAFVYELKSKRRVIVSPANSFVTAAEWSRDGIQIFFTSREGTKGSSVCRIFWDGSGFKRQRVGSSLVVGQ